MVQVCSKIDEEHNEFLKESTVGTGEESLSQRDALLELLPEGSASFPTLPEGSTPSDVSHCTTTGPDFREDPVESLDEARTRIQLLEQKYRLKDARLEEACNRIFYLEQQNAFLLRELQDHRLQRSYNVIAGDRLPENDFRYEAHSPAIPKTRSPMSPLNATETPRLPPDALTDAIDAITQIHLVRSMRLHEDTLPDIGECDEMQGEHHDGQHGHGPYEIKVVI